MKNMTVKQYIENHRQDLAIVADSADIVIAVEVPHQLKATTFMYFGKNEYERLYLSGVEAKADKGDGIKHPEGTWSAETVEEYAGHDLHSWRKLVGLDEVLNYVPVDHQRLEVYREITKDLLAAGVLEVEEEDDVEEDID